MIDKIRKAIKAHSLLRRGDTVCVAVSGGVDSTVLLHLLCELRDELSLSLVVCHLNHNLRGPEAARDRDFVRMLASDLDLPFECGKLLKKDIKARSGESLQEWARMRRVEFLNSCADKYEATRIALGHNKDDQAETIVMRLIKGASLRGLTGIGWKRERFVRPVLGLTRAEIEAYASENNIAFVEDSSNKTTKYLRNDIRRNLMPVLAGYNPRVKEAIARTSEFLREDEATLAGLAAAAFKKARSGGLGRTGEAGVGGSELVGVGVSSLIMDRKVLLALDPAIFRRVFTLAVYSLGTGDTGAEPALYTAQIDAFRALVKGRAPNTALKLCTGLFAGRSYDKITISCKPLGLAQPMNKAAKEIIDAGEEVSLDIPGSAAVYGVDALVTATIVRSMPKKPVTAKSAYFDMDRLDGPLTVRTFRAGDRICQMGMAGHKKLKDIFIDDKVGLDKRRGTLLVLSGGIIIWACGLRRSGAAPVTEATRRVVRLSLKQGP